MSYIRIIIFRLLNNLFFNSLLLGVGLAMDAFSVSLANGLNESKMKTNKMLLVAGMFAVFQGLMPMLGYFLGSTFADKITSIDHWIAFALLSFIGLNMIREAVWGDEESGDEDFGPRKMFLMAVATSIDAFAVGVTFSFGKSINIFKNISVIGITTFIIAALGVKVGSIFGGKYRSKAELFGGVILVLIGTHLLLKGLGVLSFLPFL